MSKEKASSKVEARKKYYFAYGSNLNTIRMFSRCKGAILGRKAELAGFRLAFNENLGGRAVANLIEDDSSTAVGAVYMVNDADILILDKYEGYPTVYDRYTVEVTLKGGKVVSAITYLMVESEEGLNLGVPTKDYLSHLLNGFSQWGLPKISLLKALEELNGIKPKVKTIKTTQFVPADTDSAEVAQEAPSGKHRVFVYGSLLSGFWNNKALLSGEKLIGEALLEGQYALYHLTAGFPALVSTESRSVVVGEVYEVDDNKLKELDRLEGYRADDLQGSMYRRAMAIVNTDDGKRVKAFVYIFQRGVSNAARLVKSGDWAQFMGRAKGDN